MRKFQPIYLIVAALLLAMLLSACGGATTTTTTTAPGAQAPAATEVPVPPTATPEPVEGPEDRVKGFFATLSEAFNDPDLSDETRRVELATQLAGFAEPAEQDALRDELMTTLAEYGETDFGAMFGEENMDVRLEVKFLITETRLVEESGDSAKVEVLDGIISTQLVGADADKLGEMAAMINQESSIGEFFGEEDDDRIVELKRIDGVWYFVDTGDFGL